MLHTDEKNFFLRIWVGKKMDIKKDYFIGSLSVF